MDDVERLVSAARGGDTRAVARMISCIEDADAAVPDLMARLASPHAGENPYVVGLTGAPGVGKSTATSALIAHWRGLDARVAVLAIDPSSPFTGGALLGDRVRMQTHATDPNVFIRSMGSRGHLGGVAAATPQAIRVLEATGFDVVLVETVGVGQAEVDIAAMADTTVVLLAPGMGDGVQAAKAGVLEIADILVVNKADRAGADDTMRELRRMISTVAHEAGAWRTPVVKTVATAEGGIGELVEAVEKHRGWLATSGEKERRAVARAAQEIRSLAVAMLTGTLGLRLDDPRLTSLASSVVEGRLDVYAAARHVVEQPGVVEG